MTVIPTDFAQINWSFTGTSLPHGADVTLGVDVSSYGGSPDNAATDARDAWADNMLARQVNTVALTLTRIKFGPNDIGPTGEAAGGGSGAGSNPGISPQVSALVHKSTLFGGHAGRGRMFVPGLSESDVNNAGAIDSGALAAWQTSVEGLLADLATALLIPVLLHSVGSPLTAPSTITTFTVDALAATQRRRLRR